MKSVEDAGSGTVRRTLSPRWLQLLVVIMAMVASVLLGVGSVVALSVGTYDQCANDDGDGYPVPTGCDWITGDLVDGKATYAEGDATVQRLWLTDLAPESTHTVTLKYMTSKGGSHAYDFLTTWNWSENWIEVADRCQGITGCATATEDALAIPDDPNVLNTIEFGGRQFVMRGGDMTAATSPQRVSGDPNPTSYADNNENEITINFTVAPSGSMCTTDNKGTTCGVALWFGAHVAKTTDWMPVDSRPGAGSISGSPYHVAFSAMDGAAVGQRDNQMSAGVVIDILPTVDLTKTVTPITYAEPGGEFSYTLTVKNTSAEQVTITALTDDNPLSAQCTALINTTLAAGASATCTYKVSRAEVGSYPNTASVTVKDNENNTATDTDNKTVTVTNVNPTVDLTKTVTPVTLAEPGGVFTYTLTIKNTSVEQVTITALTDNNLLSAQCTALISTTLAAGASTSCSYTVNRTEAGSFPNTASVTVKDNENNTVSDTDNKTVTVTNVLPTIEVTKTANPTAVPETGGDVVFNFVVKNTSSQESVTITSLSDDKFGVLAGDGDCQVGTVLTAGTSCEFSATKLVKGDFSGPDHVNVFTARAVDNDSSEATDTDDATVDFTNVAPTIEVTKTASPTAVPETGGNATFTFVVKNTSSEAVTITALSDDKFGSLAGDADCKVGTVLAVGASCEFSTTQSLSGNVGTNHTNIFTGTAEDNDKTPASDTDDATVTFTDVAPTITVDKTANPTSLPQPGGPVEFTVVVTNNSTESVTLTSLADDIYDNLNGRGSCATGGLIAAGASYTCSFTGQVTGVPSAHTDVVTAVATDDDRSQASDTDDATVTITNVNPTVKVTKTANPASVPETGGNATFTFVVENTSSAEQVKITSLVDNVFGTLAGDADCQVDTVLATGASCSFNATFAIPAGDFPGSHVNTFTATVIDDQRNTDAASDDETVTYTDVLPDITVTKTASPTSVPETGGNATFTFVVTNNAAEAATITALSDDKFGTLAGDADCQVGTVLAGKASCSFGANFAIPAGNFPGSHVNVFTAKATDGDGNEDTATESETVTYTDVVTPETPVADVSIDKTDSPVQVALNGTITYTLSVKNNSTTTTANGVTVTDILDSNTTFVSASGAICSAANGVVTCNVGALSAGQTVAITINATVNATAPTGGTVQTGACSASGGTTGVDLCNKASVSATTSDLTPGNNNDSESTDVQSPPSTPVPPTPTSPPSEEPNERDYPLPTNTPTPTSTPVPAQPAVAVVAGATPPPPPPTPVPPTATPAPPTPTVVPEVAGAEPMPVPQEAIAVPQTPPAQVPAQLPAARPAAPQAAPAAAPTTAQTPRMLPTTGEAEGTQEGGTALLAVAALLMALSGHQVRRWATRSSRTR